MSQTFQKISKSIYKMNKKKNLYLQGVKLKNNEDNFYKEMTKI